MKEHKTNGQKLNFPVGIPGTTAQYRYILEKDVPKSTVRTLILTLGKVEETSKTKYQWLILVVLVNTFWSNTRCANLGYHTHTHTHTHTHDSRVKPNVRLGEREKI